MRQYRYLGVMGDVAFVLAFVLGSTFIAATGIPLTGGVRNSVVFA